jgi:hypothetical protein
MQHQSRQEQHAMPKDSRCLGTETVKGTARSLEGIHDVERGHGFPNRHSGSATTNKVNGAEAIFKARWE